MIYNSQLLYAPILCYFETLRYTYNILYIEMLALPRRGA